VDKKIKVLALLSIIIVAVGATSLVLATQLTAKGNTNSITPTNAQQEYSSINATNAGTADNGTFFVPRGFGFGGPMSIGGGFRQFGGRGGCGGPGGFGAIQVSSDFTQNVTNIAKNDSDVQNLLNQGYNITSIRPVITTSIDGNGNIVAKASKANLVLQGTNGRAFVVVDLGQSKVTKIVTLTVTEINK